jgi:probable rRNA maturation factor
MLIPDWLKDWEFSLWIVTDGEIRSLNRTRRGKDSATDVLSFPLLDFHWKVPIQIIGEVVISWDATIRQAREVGHEITDEFYRLLVHGILHLFGYDHETSESDAKEMREKESELLKLVLGEGDWV